MQTKRKTNMNIHHKNMQKIAQDMQNWVASNLSHLQVLECAYGHYDINHGTFMAMPMIHSWYCEYLEKGLDLRVAERLKSKINFWSENDKLYNNYQKHIKDHYTSRDFYKFDIVNTVPEGFEMLAIGVHKKLSSEELIELQRAFRVLSYFAFQVRKRYRNCAIELRAFDAVKQLFENQGIEPTDGALIDVYAKAKFGNVILTCKEQQYIEHLLFNLTYQEIAYKHCCSVIAVRKIYYNIKKKLGNEYMSSSMMLNQLNQLGVLSLCAKKFIYNT
jgi:DNA-binding CsgD family transcriptional regulator